jgi:hypothetical protein
LVSSPSGSLFLRSGDTYYQLTGGEVIEIREPSPRTPQGLPALSLSGIKQAIDSVRLAVARIGYVMSAAESAQRVDALRASGLLSAEQAEGLAVATRRALEAKTRANLPGDLAEGANVIAAQRNVAKYGDALGPRSPADIRALKPGVTSQEIVGGSGRTSRPATASSGAIGGVGTVVAAAGTLSLADEFKNIGRGRVEIELPGLSPGDFPVGHEFKRVFLGVEDGMNWYGDVRVETNIIGRKRFYLVRRPYPFV